MKLFNRYCSAILICLTGLLLNSADATAQFTADFTTDNNGGCSPVVINFTNTSLGTSSTTSYLWDFGNGNTSALVNPGAVYGAAGSYNITLTIKDGNQTSSKTKSISVYANPTADFTPSLSKGCLPLDVHFTTNATAGSGSISNYYWDFGDGSTKQSAVNTDGHVYSVSLIASVSLTVINSYGCTRTIKKDKIIEVLPGINASFTAAKTAVCRTKDTVFFNNAGFGPGALNYEWNFGDGNTSALKEPYHLYSTPGIYSVSLTTKSSEGCSITEEKKDYVNIAKFKSAIDIPSLICSGYNYTFVSTSEPSSMHIKWYINDMPGSNTDTIALRYRFPDSGNYAIKLVNIFDGCADSVIKIIKVSKTPAINGFLMIAEDNCGAPLKVNFKDSSSNIVKWQWNFNAASDPLAVNSTLQEPTFTYLNDGAYLVKLRVEDAAGCPGYISKTIKVIKPAVSIIAAGIPAKCGPYNIAFSAKSTDGKIAYYNWDFGDGTISNDAEPVHLFGTEGNYVVKLTYTTLSGCSGSVISDQFIVFKKPIAEFTASATAVCGNSPVVFTAVPQDGCSYYWDMGDDSVISGSSTITYRYSYDSLFTVSLVVMNPAGCYDTLTKTNYVNVLPPFVKISGAENTCNGDRGLVTFILQSVKAQNLQWNFGDGNTLVSGPNEIKITHHFANTGTYKVIVSTTNTTNAQCTLRDTIITSVLLKQSAVLAAGKADLCTADTFKVNISGLELNPLAPLYANHYNFERVEYSDGTDFNGDIRADKTGGYSDTWSNYFSGSVWGQFEKEKTGLRLVMRSASFGCSDTTNVIPLNIKWTKAAFKINEPSSCFSLNSIITDLSSTNNTIVKKIWDLGDSSINNNNNSGVIYHKYNEPGKYIIYLSLVDNYGCRSSTFDTVLVKGPKAGFDVPPALFIDLPATFINTTNEFACNSAIYKWQFGDGGTATDKSPDYTFKQAGDYEVALITNDYINGCTDTLKQMVTVNNFKPAFTLNKTYLSANNCPPILAKFTNKSINYNKVIWDFGDGSTVQDVNSPSHIYIKAGKYIITLKVYGPGGLTASQSDSILVRAPEADISVSITELCIGQTLNLESKSKNAVSYTWDFGDGNILLKSDSLAAHQYKTAGIYKPFVIVYDEYGCSVSPYLNDNVKVRPNPEITFTPAAPVLCKGTAVDITATSANNYSYQWQPATGLNILASNKANISPQNTGSFYINISDEKGCSTDTGITVTVIQHLKIAVQPVAAQCQDIPLQLKASGAYHYQWLNYTNTLNSSSIADPVAKPAAPGNYIYRVAGTDAYNCFYDTTNVEVTVLPKPTVKIIAPENIFQGIPFDLKASTGSDIIQWQWSPANAVSCASCPSPVSKPSGATTYNLTVTNTSGCTATDAVTVEFKCSENAVMIPSAFSPNGDGLNDIFTVRGISMVESLQVYNRMGGLVFEKKNFYAGDNSNGWDGYYRGNPAETGAYLYFARIKCPEGNEFIKKGTVVLVR